MKPRKTNSPRHVIDRARELRNDMTNTEKKLWDYLRRRQIKGLRFRRQFPVGRYITDFCCPGIGLVIEIDGDIHDTTREYDANREKDLSSMGFTVLRFTNDDVERSLTNVVAQIIETALSMKNDV